MTKLLFLLAFLLAGCELDRGKNINPSDYVCDKSQLELVKIEYDLCAVTGYFESFCFAQAKKTQCQLATKPER